MALEGARENGVSPAAARASVTRRCRLAACFWVAEIPGVCSGDRTPCCSSNSAATRWPKEPLPWPTTSRSGVFAAGDAARGPSSVIEAIADGQRAAFYIDRYLQGNVLKIRPPQTLRASDIKVEIPTDMEKQERQQMPVLLAAERARNFREVAQGFTPEMAVAEAKRCLNCRMCANCIFDHDQLCFETGSRLLTAE